MIRLVLNQNCAVTLLGGTGFIGHHLASSLLEAGADAERHPPRHHSDPRARHPVPYCRPPGPPRRSAARSRSLAPSVLIDMTAYRAGDIIGLLPALPPSLERLVVISSGDVYWTYGAFLGLTSGSPNGRAGRGGALRDRLYPYRDRAKAPMICIRVRQDPRRAGSACTRRRR
jgi:hypothetical protein